jgi:large subunit ribosomal protein L4
VFGADINYNVLHQVVKAIEANARMQSSKKGFDSRAPLKKNRGEVVGSNKKIRAQKGSGRARVSTARSPIFVGGGLTFASCKPNFYQKVNKKMFRLAVRSAFASLAQSNRLFVGQIELEEAKTKLAKKWFEDHDINAANCLVIVENFDEKVFLATRNLPKVMMITMDEIDPRTLLVHENVLVDPAVIAKLEEKYS